MFDMFNVPHHIQVLRRIADVETLIRNNKVAIRSMDGPMKVAQTRLSNRNQRLQVENCRDRTQAALIEEVHVVQAETSKMEEKLKAAEANRGQLLATREELETEIMHKRRTIIIDRERCLQIRDHFPSALELSGYF